MNAPAVQQLPLAAERAGQLVDDRAVKGSTVGHRPAKSWPTSRSFHTQRNWKIANDAIAGVDSGSTIERKIRKWLAPSTRAASIRDCGSWAMKLCSRNMASGSANIVCADPDSASVALQVQRSGTIVNVPMCAPVL